MPATLRLGLLALAGLVLVLLAGGLLPVTAFGPYRVYLPLVARDAGPATRVPSATPTPVATVTLRVEPSATTLAVGQAATLDLLLDSGSQPVDAVALQLTVDPAVLTGLDLTPGPALPLVLAQQVDADAGRIALAVGRTAETPAPRGTVLVATLAVRGRAAGVSALAYTADSQAAHAGVYLGVRRVDGSVTVRAP